MKTVNKKHYIRIEKELIEVSEEVYRAYYQPIWKARKRAQRNGECRCPKAQLWKCDGVCPGCQFHTANRTVSLDAPIAGADNELTLGDVLTDGAPSLDSMIVEDELFVTLYQDLAHLTPEEQLICKLIATSHSEREAAEILNMSRSAFKRRWTRIQAKLRDSLKDYY